jgi:hypothetical protein
MGKRKVIERVQSLVSEVQRRCDEGTSARSLGHALGYADGYIQAVLELGLIPEQELHRAVTEARASFTVDDSANADAVEAA